MCKDCGCQEGNEKKYFKHNHEHHNNDHAHPHDHDHSRDHSHAQDYSHLHSRTVILEKNVLSKNEEFAAKNRTWLKNRGIVTINIISSPGSGKTTLLEKTLDFMKGKIHCSVIVGDQSTDNDAKRLRGRCDYVYQIETHASCHLNAEQISEVLPKVVNENTQLLFIENVGNLICPAAFELGEDFKVVLLASTEGEDKPVKYPVIFSDAPVAIITKTDLVPYLDWDVKKCRKHIREINPGMFIFELSAKTGNGMESWLDYLKKMIS